MLSLFCSEAGIPSPVTFRYTPSPRNDVHWDVFTYADRVYSTPAYSRSVVRVADTVLFFPGRIHPLHPFSPVRTASVPVIVRTTTFVSAPLTPLSVHAGLLASKLWFRSSFIAAIPTVAVFSVRLLLFSVVPVPLYTALLAPTSFPSLSVLYAFTVRPA